MEVDGEEYYDFPSPEVLANASEEDLKKCKLSRQKARYIKEFAQAVVDGYNLNKLETMSNDEAIEELIKFKGLGMWSAELILVTSLGRMALSVPDDLGMRKAVSYFFFDNVLQSSQTVREFSNNGGNLKVGLVII